MKQIDIYEVINIKIIVIDALLQRELKLYESRPCVEKDEILVSYGSCERVKRELRKTKYELYVNYFVQGDESEFAQAMAKLLWKKRELQVQI